MGLLPIRRTRADITDFDAGAATTAHIRAHSGTIAAAAPIARSVHISCSTDGSCSRETVVQDIARAVVATNR
jgi:hypothetical protein